VLPGARTTVVLVVLVVLVLDEVEDVDVVVGGIVGVTPPLGAPGGRSAPHTTLPSISITTPAQPAGRFSMQGDVPTSVRPSDTTTGWPGP
jgi:hypothetical protein